MGATSGVEKENDFIDFKNFRVTRLDFFDLHRWHYGARKEKLTKLTEPEVERYFQNTKKVDDPYQNYYYFSVQESSKTKTRITLIEEYDYCCADLYLMTYDQNDSLVGRSKVAGTGGDGGWAYDEYGNFTSDSTYRSIKVDYTDIRDDQDTSEYKIDSLVMHFSVDGNYNFEKVSEETF